ncbi:MAG: MBL fold metallo-hydrolase [Gammaproteobacteria bacterium]
MYKIVLKPLCCALFSLLFALSATAAQATTMALQVLGSGGPNDVGGRASSSYLVYLDDKSKIMIDAGGGASLRFGEASEAEKDGADIEDLELIADIEDLELIAISHLHVDHSADLTTMLKRGYTWPPESYLSFQVFGPSGNEGNGYSHPDIESFLDSFLNEENGAYRYMSVCSGYPEIEIIKIPNQPEQAEPCIYRYEYEDYTLSALNVEHANIPTIAYRVDTDSGSIAFASDQNDHQQEAFTQFVQGVDILVMHLPNEERDGPDETFWHANPSTIGEIARDAGVGKLVLSHFMDGSLNELGESIAYIRDSYTGQIECAEDLNIYSV